MKGPYNKSATQYWPGTTDRKVYDFVTWYRTDNGQQIRTPLPYSKIHFESGPSHDIPYMTVDAGNHPFDYDVGTTWGKSDLVGGNSMASINNKAYATFIDKMRDRAYLGQNIAEIEETRKLITNILGALRNPIKTFAIATNNRIEFLFRNKRKNRSTGTTERSFRESFIRNVPLKDIPDAWLAWHFGVEPLLGDLHGLLQLMKESYSPPYVSVAKSAHWTYSDKNTNTWGYTRIREDHYHGVVRFGAQIGVSNPNWADLNALGVINPASVAWEVVPFSFVVDQVIYPISLYVNAMTDFVGYTVTNPYSTWFLKGKGSYIYRLPNGQINGPWLSDGMRFNRSLTIPVVKLQPFFLPKSLSVSRAATYISLLLGFLNKTKYGNPY